jgi:ribosomal protein S13
MDQETEPKISSKERRRKYFAANTDFADYKNSSRNVLMTTRFNDFTWKENERYRQQIEKIGCIYPTPQLNNSKISPDKILFVLEMNNDKNRIMGIGMVRNHAIIKKYRVYTEENYNRYAYVGKTRIDRSEMTEEEENIMRVFDVLCFTGARHMKRLQGIKAFPMDMLYKCSKIMDLLDFITKMFKCRLEKVSKKENT